MRITERRGNVNTLSSLSTLSNNNGNDRRERRNTLRSMLSLTSSVTTQPNEDNGAKSVPKLKPTSRLSGLDDFKAAASLIPLRLTARDPFVQKVNHHRQFRKMQKVEVNAFDDDSKEEDYPRGSASPQAPDMNTKPITQIDGGQNLLAQLSSDLHLMILNMITGLGNVRTMALYRSVSSNLSLFDMARIRGCSVYKCQALFVERYRQNLFDEKYKALQQPELIRALSEEPRNLFEFQEDRRMRMMKRQSSGGSSASSEDDDEKMMDRYTSAEMGSVFG